MAKLNKLNAITNMKHISEMKDVFDPFAFECNSCGKSRVYSEEEIDKVKKPHPNPKDYAYDFFIPCPFCKIGFMEPPSFVSFLGEDDDFGPF